MNSTYEAPRRLIKTPDEIEKMRVAGRLAAEVLDMIKPHIQPGVSTLELDTLCHDYIVNVQNAIPACLGYGAAPGRPAFQHTICTSVNHVVCHGIPSADKILKKGDILNIDVTVIKDGYHGDTNMMYIVGGETSILANRLCNVAQEAMYRGIAAVKPGAYIGDIGAVIQKYVESERFSVVREYCGHGIGTVFHDEPQVLHYGTKNTGMRLEAGMTFTIEPMVNAGVWQTKTLGDKWTVVTKDHKLSAQYEHTILVTPTGAEILTARPEEDLARFIQPE
ncbi:type I methionyl aminopeptidase [Acinetobacter brisouii]|uniref:type I methionyl aminopeptidase n=1 Tax=Acinetobacter brisouii TaxID=396323 RepID=UPI0012507530|nr:type I methionyl aminopeptidase [Acinetobacter brisouii]